MRTRHTSVAFEERWSGVTLHLARRNATSDSPASIRLDHLLLDKGDIPAVGKPIEFVYPIVNTGKTELVVRQVKVNCSCLKSEKPDGPIGPGEAAEIKLSYNVEPQKGPFSRTALVTTSDETLPYFVLTACGYTGVEVHLSPSRVTLRNLYVGQRCLAECVLRYTGEWKDFQVEVEGVKIENAELVEHHCRIGGAEPRSSELDKEFSRKATSDVRKDAIRTLGLTFYPTGQVNDKVEGEVKVRTNITGYEEFLIHVSGKITSPIQSYPRVLHYGYVLAGSESVKKTVTLASRGNNRFRICDVRLEGDVVPEAVFSGRTVDREADITFSLSSDTALSHNGKNVAVYVELESTGQKLSLPLKIVAWQADTQSEDLPERGVDSAEHGQDNP